MRQAGGLVALISGILMLIAVMGTALIAGAITAMGEAAMYADSMLITGLGAAGLLIVLGAITLYVPGAWWAIGIMAVSLTAAALGGGLVAITAVLGFVGGLVAMMQSLGRDRAEQQSPEDTVAVY